MPAMGSGMFAPDEGLAGLAGVAGADGTFSDLLHPAKAPSMTALAPAVSASAKSRRFMLVFMVCLSVCLLGVWVHRQDLKR